MLSLITYQRAAVLPCCPVCVMQLSPAAAYVLAYEVLFGQVRQCSLLGQSGCRQLPALQYNELNVAPARLTVIQVGGGDYHRYY